MFSFSRKAAAWIPLTWRKRMTRQAWRQMNLTLHGERGLALELAGRTDWDTLNEILVQGEYDGAILSAIETADRERGMTIFDLGANVGFFELRLAALASAKSVPMESIRVIAIEPSTSTFNRLKKTTASWSTVRPVHAIVGPRSGTQRIFDSGASAAASTRMKGEHVEEIQCVDLQTFVASNVPIDLIKCDIEGSELEFLENYRDLLAGTRWLVIEFHHSLCDVTRCHALLDEMKFTQQALVKDLTLDTGRYTTALYRGVAAAFG